MRRGYAETEVGQVHYVEAGEDPPLILLHQTASSSVMWARALPYFSKRYHVVAMDTPGFGMSDHPSEQPTEGIPYYSKAVIGLPDHLGYEQANIVGFHTGASIAVDVAAHSPERVKSQCPVLVLNVEEEVLYSYTVKAHAAIAHSEYVEIPGPEPNVRGWVAVVPEYPREFSDAVMSFVDRVEGG